MKFSDEELVKAWENGEKTKAIAERFGCPKSHVDARISWLRLKGIKLSSRKRRCGVDVAGLNNLIKKLNKK